MLPLVVLLASFGIAGIAKGQFRITHNRRVRRSVGQTLGSVLLVGAILSLVDITYGLGALIMTIIIGITNSEPIDQAVAPTEAHSGSTTLFYLYVGFFLAGLILVALGLYTGTLLLVPAGIVVILGGVVLAVYRLAREKPAL